MNNTTLNHSMVIQMATSEVKHFDPDPAIHKWVNCSIRPRRPAFKEGSSRKRARLEKHPQAEVEVVEVYEDATAAIAAKSRFFCLLYLHFLQFQIFEVLLTVQILQAFEYNNFILHELLYFVP